jgi:uncharacterized cupredoxin-like copper-binding protein
MALHTETAPLPRAIGHRGATNPPAASPLPAVQRRAAPLTWDQFLLAQLPLAVAVALIVGIFVIMTARQLPAGAFPPSRSAAERSAGSAAVITAFTAEAATQQVRVAADPTGLLKWVKASYEAKAGDVTFVVANESMLTHNFVVEGPGVRAQSATFGAKTTNSFTLKGLQSGEYLIVCTFAGHSEAGMVARLTVR